MKATTICPHVRRTLDATSRCSVRLRKRIGSTTYKVSVRFSETSTETMQDKTLRMIEQEVSKNA